MLLQSLNNFSLPVSDFFTISKSAIDDIHVINQSDYMTVVVAGSTSVPEPTTILLFGLGLVGLAGVRKKIKK